jgi:hypothetical protein
MGTTHRHQTPRMSATSRAGERREIPWSLRAARGRQWGASVIARLDRRDMRHKPSPALIVAIVALVVALSGTAVAASHYTITSKSQIKPSVLRALKGARGATGPQGAPGPQGEAGEKRTRSNSARRYFGWKVAWAICASCSTTALSCLRPTTNPQKKRYTRSRPTGLAVKAKDRGRPMGERDRKRRETPD